VLPGPITPATSAETRQALPLLRELAGQGRVRWDPEDGLELAAALERARVVERQTGLVLVGPERTDLVRAASWALLAQAQPKPQPAIY
jgi:recombinational DNA repair ATPase RecF